MSVVPEKVKVMWQLRMIQQQMDYLRCSLPHGKLRIFYRCQPRLFCKRFVPLSAFVKTIDSKWMLVFLGTSESVQETSSRQMDIGLETHLTLLNNTYSSRSCGTICHVHQKNILTSETHSSVLWSLTRKQLLYTALLRTTVIPRCVPFLLSPKSG